MVHTLSLLYSIEVFKTVLEEKERKWEGRREIEKKKTGRETEKKKVRHLLKFQLISLLYIFKIQCHIVFTQQTHMYKISITLNISICS